MRFTTTSWCSQRTDGHGGVLNSKKYLICASCGNKGTALSKCENVRYQSSSSFKEASTTLCSFKLLPKITAISERHKLLSDEHGDYSSMTDILNAQVCRKIISKERALDPNKLMITLLPNSNSVVRKRFNRSLWITCMLINELPRAVRFNTKNIIICSTSTGANKQKNQFQSFIADCAYELRQLELGFYVSLRISMVLL